MRWRISITRFLSMIESLLFSITRFSQVIFGSRRSPVNSTDVPGFEDLQDVMGDNHDMAASEWGNIPSNNDMLGYHEEEKLQNSNCDRIPNNTPQEKEDGEPQIQVSNPRGSEQSRGNFLQQSSSRTHTDIILEKINQDDRALGVLNASSLNQIMVDSEATVGNNQPEQPLINDLSVGRDKDNEAVFGFSHSNCLGSNGNQKELPLQNSLEIGFCDSPLNSDDDIVASPRRKSKSKAKRKKLLKEKCMLIQKKIKKKQCKKSNRQFQKELILQESFVEEARRAWETTKAAGLSTKGQDEEVVARIAMNLAEEAEQRKTRNQQ